jgi:hypothetical protein
LGAYPVIVTSPRAPTVNFRPADLADPSPARGIADPAIDRLALAFHGGGLWPDMDGSFTIDALIFETQTIDTLLSPSPFQGKVGGDLPRFTQAVGRSLL